MGVNGLWPLLTSAIEHVDVCATLQGKRVAVDWMVWLHRAAASHAFELLAGNLEPALGHLTLALGQLITNGVDIVVILDGEPLPSKADEVQRRSARRQIAVQEYESIIRNKDCESSGNDAKRAATLAATVTPELIEASINLLRKQGIAYAVAPYEADSQLAWLSRNGLVDAVLSVDSDLAVLGAECIIRGIDRWGMGEMFVRSKLKASVTTYKARSSGAKPTPQERFLDFLQNRGVDDGLRLYASLRGCDYVKSPLGVGTVALLKILESCAEITSPRAIAARVAPTDNDYANGVQGAMLMFTKPVCLDITSQLRVCLDSSPPPTSTEACWTGDMDNNVDTLNARAAMGHVYRGRAFELVDVSLARHAGVALPTALREDEVPGAQLDTTRPWKNGFPTIAQMVRFLRTRDISGIHGAVREHAHDADDPRPPVRKDPTWDDIARVCKDIIQREAIAKAEGRVVVVRDPDGGTLMRRLLEGDTELASAVRASTGGREGRASLPERPDIRDIRWVKGASALRTSMPKASMAIIGQHLEARCAGAHDHCRAVRQGNQLVAERTHHSSFRWHPGGSLGGTSGDTGRGHITYKCRASYSLEKGMEAYEVGIAVDYVGDQMVYVHAASCTCKAAKSGACSHVVATLLVAVFFSRPCTSVACAWRAPTSRDGGNADVLTPVSRVIVRKPRLPDAAAPTQKNNRARNEHKVLTGKFVTENHDKDHPERKRLRAALYDVLERDIGRPCAASIVWPIK